jgi:hypothetical protein
MKPIDQSIVCEKNGDCTRACLASILEMELDAVPNFMRFGKMWFGLFSAFLRFLSYDYYGTGFPLSDKRPMGDKLEDSPNVDGFVIASVPSSLFPNSGHSVVMDLKGVVVHDPNPNKYWQNKNVLESKELQHWMMIGKINKTS